MTCTAPSLLTLNRWRRCSAQIRRSRGSFPRRTCCASKVGWEEAQQCYPGQLPPCEEAHAPRVTRPRRLRRRRPGRHHNRPRREARPQGVASGDEGRARPSQPPAGLGFGNALAAVNLFGAAEHAFFARAAAFPEAARDMVLAPEDFGGGTAEEAAGSAATADSEQEAVGAAA